MPGASGSWDGTTVEAITDIHEGTTVGLKTEDVRTLEPDFEEGTPEVGTAVEVAGDEPVELYDVIEVDYRCLPIFQSWQRRRLVEKLRQDDRIELLYFAHWPEKNMMRAQYRVLKTNPFPIIAIAAIAVALAVGIGFWLTATSIKKITGFSVDVNGDGRPEFEGSGLILIAVLVVGLIVWKAYK